MPDELYEYLLAHSSGPDDLQSQLIDETAALGTVARMQIAPEQGTFLTLLVRATGARRAIEVGTFTGYSSLAIARGLPPGGLLVCCDVSDEWTEIARRYWHKAGVAERIRLELGPALQTLRGLPTDEPFDLAFIDADKGNYLHYYEELLRLVRPGGLILADNVLWSGRVVDPEDRSDDTGAIRDFNRRLAADDRVEIVMLPLADGLTMALVK
jgi:caffeoyl-CoA O-methyltransferase